MKSWLLKHLYCVPDLNDIIKVDKNGNIIIGGEIITKMRKEKLIEEAYIIANSELWKIMTETLKEQACKKMFEKSESWVDMLGGKFILYSIDVQKRIVKLFHKAP